MHALEALAYVLETQPEIGQSGRVLFMRARPHACLERFKSRLTCEQTWKPHASALEDAGFSTTREATVSYDLILLLPERQRETVLADIARAYDLLAEGGTLMVALHNDWGAKRTEQQLAEIAGPVTSISKHHSRVFSAVKQAPWNVAPMAAWKEAASLRRAIEGRFWSCPGLFHWNEIDAGSRLLTQNLPPTLAGAAADLGCSWGYLSDHVLRQCPNLRSLDVYEADSVALECARRNLGLVPSPVRARLHWQDVAAGVGRAKFDVVVMNPPFHDGRDADPTIGLRFITAAAVALRPQGELWLVANKHLPYENLLTEAFEQSSKVVEAGAFKVLHASRPRALPQARPVRGKR